MAAARAQERFPAEHAAWPWQKPPEGLQQQGSTFPEPKQRGTKREARAGSPPALPLTLARGVSHARSHVYLGGYFPRLFFPENPQSAYWACVSDRGAWHQWSSGYDVSLTR